MTPHQYCQQKAAKSGSSFYYSFLFLPPKQRQAIIALYAFCREVDDSVDDCSDPFLAESRLNWWRSEVKKIYTGEATHPVSQAMMDIIEHFPLHQEYLEEIIDGMSMDLQNTHYQSFDELLLYCHRAAGVVGLLAAEIFGYEQRDTLKFAENLGLAFQLTNILRDVKEDAMRGRVYLPEEDLNAFKVKPEDFLENKTSSACKALFEHHFNRTMQYYQKAFSYLPESDRFFQKSSLIMSAIYLALLEEIKKDGFRVMEHRIHLTPVRKLWIAWKTNRQESKRNKQHTHAGK